jgi:hydroxymethylpyrimidine/phosphomethylpyrimidine kinase
MSAIVALTAQSTTEVRSVHEAPPEFIRDELEVVFDDIGVDAAKTGMLFSRRIIETVADFLATTGAARRRPGDGGASGAKLLQDDAVEVLVGRLLPLATVVTPNLHEACALAGVRMPTMRIARNSPRGSTRSGLGRDRHGGHGTEAVDWLYDGEQHVPIPVERHESDATHGAGCTHSATLTALLARGESLEDAARGAARIASEAVRAGLTGLGAGSGPVDVLNLEAVRSR